MLHACIIPSGGLERGRASATVPGVQPRDVLLAVNAAFSRRDPAAMVERFAADAVVTDHRQGGLGSWRGHDELLAYYAGICDSAHELREDLEILTEDGDVVIADCVFNARLSEDGAPDEFSLRYSLFALVRDGLVQELGVHQDAASARAQAAGMPETS
jgi:ketosteroid isomerase-like protein